MTASPACDEATSAANRSGEQSAVMIPAAGDRSLARRTSFDGLTSELIERGQALLVAAPAENSLELLNIKTIGRVVVVVVLVRDRLALGVEAGWRRRGPARDVLLVATASRGRRLALRGEQLRKAGFGRNFV